VSGAEAWDKGFPSRKHSRNKSLCLVLLLPNTATFLLLVLVRIVVRLAMPPPPLPAGLASWERILAGASHLLFYALMLILPLTGWALVSLSAHSISFWGLPWPHLPGVGEVFGSPAPRSVRHQLAHVHVYILIWIVWSTWPFTSLER